MLPTEKAKIYKENDKLYFHPETMHIPVNPKPQHLYFLSDEKIKDNDVYLQKGKLFVAHSNFVMLNKDPETFKVIASTDSTFNSPRPSNEFLKKFCEVGGIDEVLVEYDCDHNQMPNKVIDVLKVAPDNTISIYPIK